MNNQNQNPFHSHLPTNRDLSIHSHNHQNHTTLSTKNGPTNMTKILKTISNLNKKSFSRIEVLEMTFPNRISKIHSSRSYFCDYFANLSQHQIVIYNNKTKKLEKGKNFDNCVLQIL